VFEQNNQALLEIEKLIRSKSLALAAERLNGLQAKSRDDPRIYALGAFLGLAASNPKATLLACGKALELAPGWGRALAFKAQAHESLGELPEALMACETAVANDPSLLECVELAAAIGRRIGDTSVAQRILVRLHELSPDDARVWLGLGRLLSRSNPKEAIEWFNRVLQRDANSVDALVSLAALHQDSGERELAKGAIERALAIDPNSEIARYQAARIRGDGSQQIPQALVRVLFDDYAERFDESLVGQLNYRLPELIASRIRELYPLLKLNILDLGCGTGLLGHVLGSINGYFIGVDLSEKMLQQAAKRGVYQRLHMVDIVEALAATDASEYEVIVAADVVVYLAQLDRFTAESLRVLRPGGNLIFSCELAEASEPEVVLRDTQRYAHRIDSVRALCERVGFAAVTIEEMVVRMNKGQPVKSFLVTATKSA
jgi:predicted TPR repeat methyltransferase